MSVPSRLQELRLARRVAIALLVAACASPRTGGERRPASETRRSAPGSVAAPAPPRAVVPEGWVRYVVQPGDTLGRIAACRGVRVQTLAEANELRDPRRILAGAQLRVPPHDRCLATGVAGEERRARAPAPDAALAHGKQLLAQARARYDAADFEAALHGADAAAGALESEPGSPPVDHLRARCHALAALAAAGLEQRDRAISEFRLAFALDPGLTLSRDDASPRVQELVDAARAQPTDAAR